jgi:hypothetical protein
MVDLFKTQWDQFDSDGKKLCILASLIPPPISLDLWTKAASTSSVTVLQFAEKLVNLKIMKVYKPLGLGHYYFKNPNIIKDLISLIGSAKIVEIAQSLSVFLNTELHDGPHLWMALAYLYQ